MLKLFCARMPVILFFLLTAQSAFAQTTTFTYQGRFTDSTTPQPTNGTYEMQFKAFDAATNGNQFASTATLPSVHVVNGIFTVSLDFGALTFRGADVFLEIAVRPAGNSNAFTTLAPRQQFTSAPYSILSLNSINANLARDSMALGSFPASQYVQINDVRLTDDRNPLAGSANYVQNQNAAAQILTKFNISGSGSADIFNAATQYNIGGNRVLSVKGGVNVFVGVNAGTANTNGNSNTFVGDFSGNANTNGTNNAFFGTDSGRNNQANSNSFFGRSSGFANTSGTSNSFFGLDSGRFNVAGNNNSFFGFNSGSFNLADNNSFFGYQAGVSNTTGSNNTMLGYNANVTANNLNFATAIGAGASVSTSNTIVLGTASISTEIPGTLKVFTLGAAGATTLCRNAANQIATCTGGGGGGNFIQNSTVLQPSADFNISGGGVLGGTLSANIVNSATNFRIGNVAVFSTPVQTSVVAGQSSNFALVAADSTFIGFKTGTAANSFSQANTFIGSNSGTTTTSGGNNSFIGKDAGFFNLSGSFNTFVGSSAGKSNTTADGNSFFGYESGLLNTNGTRNAFFGFQSGRNNSTAADNAFFGYQSGNANTGANNSFFGSSSGVVNNSGNNNAFFGSLSGIANNSGANNSFFGSLSGSANTNGIQNTFVGSKSGSTNISGSSNTLIGYSSDTTGDGNTVVGANSGNTVGNNNTIVGLNSFTDGGDENTVIGYNAKVSGTTPRNHSTAIGADAVADTGNSIVLGTAIDTVYAKKDLIVTGNSFADNFGGNFLNVGSITATGQIKTVLMSGGATQVCRNAQNILSTCSSSLRYKTNIAPYFGGLNLLNLLNPIIFDWKDGGMHDLGFGAEDVAKIDPLLVTYNENGQVEGVKYDRLTTILVNSVKEQQTQINAQNEQIKQQQNQIEELKQIVCAANPTAKFCQ